MDERSREASQGSTSEVARPFSAPERILIARSYHITEKELELLELVSEGMNAAEAAKELGIAHATASTKLQKIHLKLNARTTCQAVAIGVRNHFIK